MKTWSRAPVDQACGGACRSVIPAGQPMLVIRVVDTKRVRCAACAKAMFGEDPPADIDGDVLVAPQPSLQGTRLERYGHGFVSTRTLAQKAKQRSAIDFKQRQIGKE